MSREAPTWAEIRHVMTHLRPRSLEEITMQGGEPLLVAVSLVASRGVHRIVHHDGVPCAFTGAVNLGDGLWSLFGFGTPDWERQWRVVTLVSRRCIVGLFDAGARRASALSPASHEPTHRWLRALGATKEVPMPGHGVHGEDFIRFIWER